MVQPVFGFCVLGLGGSCDGEEPFSERVVKSFQSALSFIIGDSEESQASRHCC